MTEINLPQTIIALNGSFFNAHRMLEQNVQKV
jgi:hypothetical protein